jgi:phosphatidylglycerophosphatase A
LGFGSGLAWLMPGTFGTLMGWLLYVLIDPYLTSTQWWWVILSAFFIGSVCCQITGKSLGVVDHGSIVFDEIVAIWLVLFVSSNYYSDPIEQLYCVLIFRLFDMLKPPPIRWFDRNWKNGFGVMFDDIVAALITLLVLAFNIHLVQ